MAIPQIQVKSNVRELRKNDDPVPDDEVRAVQFMLAFVSGGYSPFDRALRPADGVDGRFGPKTDERVRRFQTKEKLEVDGIVGEETWTALLERWNNFQTVG
ncbi:peptidoglycan-binding domain-containing protein [Actinoplanes sp. Pm04-4]|uniref:Peptidoglycan-binding domain-containing protein n=1 Tax=Paractinoplanes pyxinae TaxID=2997416 RepID=A0ABT4B313_9ACTN|nr:peptidoglycan-binding domain-containing protein [Actinoplanes pyxinae]MCY1140891.1 peptidoglycan-binding domain-containing protein [Actinoplanes pyxinae]